MRLTRIHTYIPNLSYIALINRKQKLTVKGMFSMPAMHVITLFILSE